MPVSLLKEQDGLQTPVLALQRSHDGRVERGSRTRRKIANAAISPERVTQEKVCDPDPHASFIRETCTPLGARRDRLFQDLGCGEGKVLGFLLSYFAFLHSDQSSFAFRGLWGDGFDGFTSLFLRITVLLLLIAMARSASTFAREVEQSLPR